MRFDQAAYVAFHKALRDEADEIMFAKMADYARPDDQLSNFKEGAELMGLTPLRVWSVYFWKHICSVMRYVRDGRVESEDIRDRFIDIINYGHLGAALAEAEKEGRAGGSTLFRYNGSTGESTPLPDGRDHLPDGYDVANGYVYTPEGVLVGKEACLRTRTFSPIPPI